MGEHTQRGIHIQGTVNPRKMQRVTVPVKCDNVMRMNYGVQTRECIINNFAMHSSSRFFTTTLLPTIISLSSSTFHCCVYYSKTLQEAGLDCGR